MNKQVRAEVFLRDGFACTKCDTAGSKKNPLTIHHIMPKCKFPRLVNDPDNCQVLCQRHHDEVHGIHRGTRKRVKEQRYWTREMGG